jgi:AraC-like DNA-binding protein
MDRRSSPDPMATPASPARKTQLRHPDGCNTNQPAHGFAKISIGREILPANQRLRRHRHDRAYAAIVLSGGYEECGSRGRFGVEAGDVLLHYAFDAHLNAIRRRGAQILNLVDTGSMGNSAIGHVGDPDAIARAAERDFAEAGALLSEQLCGIDRAPEDWPDILARDLTDDPGLRLDCWAKQYGLAPETISRGFGRVFGIPPASFRAEARARRAFALITESSASLAAIAAVGGFADQAHMCRSVRALTGSSPSAWRRSNPFKTGPVSYA